MAKRRTNNPLDHIKASDLRGLAHLAKEASSGITRITEGVHQSVWDTMNIPRGKNAGKTRGITGLVYKCINGVTQLTGKGSDILLTKLEPLLTSPEFNKADTFPREAVLSALNGVMGDRLEASHSPFTTSMSLRYERKALDLHALKTIPKVSGKILLLVHGLCMNDLQWRVGSKSHSVDYGELLASALGYTPVYLRYNSGLHISENGRQLSAQLAKLTTHWPTPIEELSIIAHSMGGLVSRSACHYSMEEPAQEVPNWTKYLRHMIFLGSPHHGAPLEQLGNKIDVILESTPYTAPFSALAQLRSAGITDLRYGNVREEDWHGYDRFSLNPDNRQVVPLPKNVACHTVAATTAKKPSKLIDNLVGDGLVPLPSALGQHKDKQRNLAFTKESQWIAYDMNHMELLNSPEVAQQMIKWLTP